MNPILVGVMASVAVYLLLQNRFKEAIMGAALLSNAINLLLLSSSGSAEGKSAPLIASGALPYVDPLPQALILTAIVIGFALIASLVVISLAASAERGK